MTASTRSGVGLVRGINVGPTTAVAMSDLAAAFEATGLSEVRTMLRSGNVVFSTDRALDGSVSADVEAELATRSGVAARVLLIEADEFRRVAAANPLLQVAGDFSKLVVTFLGDDGVPDELLVPDADSIAPELVRVGERAIYQWCPLGVSKTRLTPSFWRQLTPAATARNWRTVLRIHGELDTRT